MPLPATTYTKVGVRPGQHTVTQSPSTISVVRLDKNPQQTGTASLDWRVSNYQHFDFPVLVETYYIPVPLVTDAAAKSGHATLANIRLSVSEFRYFSQKVLRLLF